VSLGRVVIVPAAVHDGYAVLLGGGQLLGKLTLLLVRRRMER
jgi:hypothetical protein